MHLEKTKIRYSIVMPVYNGRDYFQFALNSAVSCLGASDEIIVVEDGSTDGGVEEFVKKTNDQRVRYFFQNNSGVASALNTGINHARNSYFCWLSHDDMFLPNRLDSDRNIRQLIPNIVTFSSFIMLFEPNGRIQAPKFNGLRKQDQFASSLLARRFLNGCTVTSPISLIRECGMFDEKLRHVQDYDMWLKILDTSEFHFLQEPLVISRQHSNQDSKKMPEDAKKEYRKMVRQHSGKIKLRMNNIYNLALIMRGLI